MNKNLLKMGSTITMAISLIVAAGCSSEGSSTSDGKEVIKLRGSTFIPAEHGAFDQINPWIEQVETESNGQVKFEIFTSGELVKAGKSYDSIMSGVTDVELSFLA